jgi:DNA replication protein DnaC
MTPGTSEVCPICKGKGFLVYDVPPGHPDFSKVQPCRCTQARLAQERAQNLRTVSNLGQLSRMSFDNFIPGGVGLSQMASFNLQEAYNLAREFAREPKGWLVLLGGYGCGKTHLAVAIANHRLALGHAVMFVVVSDLLDYLRGAFAPDSTTSLDERLETIRETPLLILDDLGAHNSTPWAQEKLFQIINHRYNARLATVITSNQRLEDLDPRITSRLVDADLSHAYEILAPDFRQSGVGRGSTGLNALDLYGDKTFESFVTREHERELEPEERSNLQNALQRARNFAEKPQGWLVLSGANGCGKTHLAAAIANYQVTIGQPTPIFVVVADLLDHLRATFSPTSNTTLDKVFEQVRSTALLVLDDFITTGATPWASEKLNQLLNHRYVTRLPTVITTAENIDQIEEAEPRLASRMLDKSRCTFFLITAPGYYTSRRRPATRPPAADTAPARSRTSARPRGQS